MPLNRYFGEEKQYLVDVFVIMPFRQEYDHLYHDVVKPVCAELKLAVRRGDDFQSDRIIMQQVWAAISDLKLVIAECSEPNPNVYYELGIAHSLNKPSIIITKDPNTLAFDIRHLRAIVYNDGSQAEDDKLRSQLRERFLEQLGNDKA